MRDWENLRYFMAVARNGTVSGAAAELAVSHSTVLRRIDQFEKNLDSKLFKRLQSGYELSAAGEKLYRDGKDVEAELDKLMAQAEGHFDVTGGKLRISQPETGILDVYPLYAKFQRLHPEITLEIHSTMAAHNLNQQEVDIVLRISDNPPELLVGRSLGQFKARLYASKDYLKQLPKNHTINDYDWIIWQSAVESVSRQWLKDNLAEAHIVLYAESMPDVVSAVLSGMGVGFLSSHEARKHSQLVELLDGKAFNSYQLWILTHRDLRNSERVKTFMRFMAENLKLE